MPGPEITVVVPTFRRPGCLPELVRRLEAQTLAPHRFEVVVVDNGSGDSTLDVLAALAAASPLDIRILEFTDAQGPAGARNAGWRAGRAPFVACTDDDCAPEPGWLEAGLAALQADPRVGVVQGRTHPPPGRRDGEWVVYREIGAASPFFEGCNLFFRRDALDASGGFDEVLGMHFEDTAAGWRVVDAGWERAFAPDAVVVHPVEHRGFRWHLRVGFAERNMVRIAKRHPGFRRTGCWRPWSYQRDVVLLDLAWLGIAIGLRYRLALCLALPYVRHAIRSAGPRPRPGYVLERAAVDTARSAGHLVGSIENRTVVL